MIRKDFEARQQRLSGRIGFASPVGERPVREDFAMLAFVVLSNFLPLLDASPLSVDTYRLAILTPSALEGRDLGLTGNHGFFVDKIRENI